MAYEKRVCVLKQMKKGFSADGGTLSGAVYAERLGEILTVTPRVLGLAPLKEGRYVLALSVGGEQFLLALKGNESLSVPCEASLKEGFSALVCYLKGEAQPIAFGRCGVASADYTPLLAAITHRDGEKKGEKKRDARAEVSPAASCAEEAREEEAETARPFRGKYDDEAIAASDYYGEAHEDEHASYGSGANPPQENEGGGAGQDEEAVPPLLRPKGTLSYYRTVQKRLDEAFQKFPPDERLKSVFPASQWARGDGALLGIIYEEGQPRYLCVAREAEGEPPEQMKDKCSFVPASPFTETEGFYVVFQDADTGEYVTVGQS